MLCLVLDTLCKIETAAHYSGEQCCMLATHRCLTNRRRGCGPMDAPAVDCDGRKILPRHGACHREASTSGATGATSASSRCGSGRAGAPSEFSAVTMST